MHAVAFTQLFVRDRRTTAWVDDIHFARKHWKYPDNSRHARITEVPSSGNIARTKLSTQRHATRVIGGRIKGKASGLRTGA